MLNLPLQLISPAQAILASWSRLPTSQECRHSLCTEFGAFLQWHRCFSPSLLVSVVCTTSARYEEQFESEYSLPLEMPCYEHFFSKSTVPEPKETQIYEVNLEAAHLRLSN